MICFWSPTRMPGWLWRAVAQWSEHLQQKQEALGSIPSGCPDFFSFSWLTNVDGMKDLWCSSTVQLVYISIDMNGSSSTVAINEHGLQ